MIREPTAHKGRQQSFGQEIGGVKTSLEAESSFGVRCRGFGEIGAVVGALNAHLSIGHRSAGKARSIIKFANFHDVMKIQ